VRHVFENIGKADPVNPIRQADFGKNVSHARRVLRRKKSQPHGQFGRRPHPQSHGLAVMITLKKSRGLNGVPDGMPKVEDRPDSLRFFFVLLHDPRLDPAAA
jgi:hypothetical protein